SRPELASGPLPGVVRDQLLPAGDGRRRVVAQELAVHDERRRTGKIEVVRDGLVGLDNVEGGLAAEAGGELRRVQPKVGSVLFQARLAEGGSHAVGVFFRWHGV